LICRIPQQREVKSVRIRTKRQTRAAISSREQRAEQHRQARRDAASLLRGIPAKFAMFQDTLFRIARKRWMLLRVLGRRMERPDRRQIPILADYA
jgi:hypothetical protein